MFPLVVELPGISEWDRSSPVEFNLDAARKDTRVDEVLAWGPAPATGGFTGKGVIVADIDDGFETHHPAFLDAEGKTRFAAIWDMNLGNDGSSPFGNGRVRNRAALQADSDFGQGGSGHGSHVISLAGGSPKGSPYYGMAPGATLVGVKTRLGAPTGKEKDPYDVEIMNGIQWVFRLADSLKMPAVVNLSLGHHWGPHDGTSIFDRFLDSITGPGRIVVGSAGNEAALKLHVGFTLKPGDTAGTWIDVDRNGKPTPYTVILGMDVWGEPGKPFSFKILLRDDKSDKYISSRGFQLSSDGDGKEINETVPWTDPVAGTSTPVQLSWRLEKANPANGRPHLRLVTYTHANVNPGIRLVGDGQVHVWNIRKMALYSDNMAGFKGGDAESNVGEVSGTSRSIISVGAFTSKSAYQDYLGKPQDVGAPLAMGDLAPYSSRGPTLDGRVKPDICAPGRTVVGALGVPDASQEPASSEIVVWPAPEVKAGRFFAMEGTSMSSPVVAGVVALMLEANKSLTPKEILAILKETAYKDANTGPLTTPSNLWGAGKIDAAAAVRKAKQAASIPGGSVARRTDGPGARYAQGRLVVDGLAFSTESGGRIYDWNGRLVSPLRWEGGGRFALERKLDPGVYIAVLEEGVHSYRMLWHKD